MGMEPIKQVLTVLDPNKTDYTEVPGSAGAFQVKPLGDDAARQFKTYLSRIAPGAGLTWHWHTLAEEFVILKGTALTQIKDQPPVRLEAGAYSQFPGKTIHRFCNGGQDECIVFAVGAAAYDIHWVDDGGNEISEDDAKLRRERESKTGW